MTDTLGLYKEAKEMLKETSRTFFIPISRLPAGLKEAVMSAYLCMRAIDEIEDDTELPKEEKIKLLSSLADTIKQPNYHNQITSLLSPYINCLPKVSLQMNDWIKLSPEAATPIILNATSTMAEGMSKWVEKEWNIQSKEDLDDYTYYVAGLVGVLLTDLWKWYDNIECDEALAVGFGRGLQAVNIIRNREEDLNRGVDFFPNGWEMDEMFKYARENLDLGEQYTKHLSKGPVYHFCKIPLALAFGTLNAIESGEKKLSRKLVNDIVSHVVGKSLI